MRKRRWSWSLALALAAAVWLAPGCGGDDEANGPAPDATGGDEQITAEITSLEAGATLEAGDIEVSVDVANFEVVDKLGQELVAGEGHIHYYIDVAEIPTTPGQPAVTKDDTTYHVDATTSYTWQGVRPGEHTFGVQLVNNDHTPLEPPVTDEITVTVE